MMERVLLLRLQSQGCMAEATLNGIPLARTPACGGTLTLPVHEYTLAGDNALALTIAPPPLAPGFEQAPPRAHLGDADCLASLTLQLARTGQGADAQQPRQLAQLEWVSPVAEVIELPLVLTQTVHLPVSFPRWRWADAPLLPASDSLRPQIAGLLQGMALSLAQGHAEAFIGAAGLRFEELAQAYQRDPVEELARFRAHVQQAHGEQALRPEMPNAHNLLLRSAAGGRLLECLGLDGAPALRTAAGSGPQRAWPVRVSMIEGRLYVLR